MTLFLNKEQAKVGVVAGLFTQEELDEALRTDCRIGDKEYPKYVIIKETIKTL